jgi:hypothetical protein
MDVNLEFVNEIIIDWIDAKLKEIMEQQKANPLYEDLSSKKAFEEAEAKAKPKGKKKGSGLSCCCEGGKKPKKKMMFPQNIGC